MEDKNSGWGILKKIFWLAIILVFLCFAYYAVKAAPSLIDQISKLQQPKFPELTNPTTKILTWSYQATDYSLPLTLYGSVDGYYQNKASRITLENEVDYQAFITLPSEDQEMSAVAADIKNLGEKNGLSGDKIAELVLSFVQAIPYDQAKYESGNLLPRYPYQTLYDDQGICTDKSFLLYELFQKLGYGTAIFTFDKVAGSNLGHMAAAIECPAAYSTDNSGYCYAETTASGWKVGNLPGEILNGGAVANAGELSSYQAPGGTSSSFNLPNKPNIYFVSAGNSFERIIILANNEQEMASIKSYLNKQKVTIDANEAELKTISDQLNAYESAGNIRAYNNLVPTYNNLLGRTKNLIDDYNQKVARYNELLKKN